MYDARYFWYMQNYSTKRANIGQKTHTHINITVVCENVLEYIKILFVAKGYGVRVSLSLEGEAMILNACFKNARVSLTLSLSVIFIETLAIDFGDDRESAGISISTRVIRRRVERMNVLNALVQITTRARACVCVKSLFNPKDDRFFPRFLFSFLFFFFLIPSKCTQTVGNVYDDSGACCSETNAFPYERGIIYTFLRRQK